MIHWIDAVATTAHTTGVNWVAIGALSTPTLTAITLIARFISGKLNAIGEHLKRQDFRGSLTDERVSRIEGKLGLQPLRAPRRLDE